MAESHREEIAKLEALYAGNPGGRVFVHLAEAYRKAGEHERARRILDEGLARHSDSASGYVVLGRVLADMQITTEAESAFRRVLELDGGNLVALRWLGDLARQAGRNADAALHYRELLIRNPSNEEVRDLVEIVEREAADGDVATSADEPADAFAGLSLDTHEDVEPAVSAPVSEAEEPAVSPPSGPAYAPEPDITPVAAAPGQTGDAEAPPVEFGLVELDTSASVEDTARRVEEQPAPPEEDDAPAFQLDADVAESVGGADEPAGAEFEFPRETPSAGAELDRAGARGDTYSRAAAEDESNMVASFDGDDSDVLELDELRRDDEAEPIEIHLLDPSYEGSAEEDDEEYASDLDLTDLASARPLDHVEDYADDSFVADIAAAGQEEPEPDELPGEVDVMDSALTLLPEEGEPAEPSREPEPAQPEPAHAEGELREAALTELSGAVEPAAEAAPAADVRRGETGLITETMAVLYRSQGFHDRAADVYRALLRARPGDQRLAAKLRDAEQAAGSRRAAPPPAAEEEAGEVWLRGVGSAWTAPGDEAAEKATPYAWTGEADDAEAGEPIGSYLQDLVSWKAGSGAWMQPEAAAADDDGGEIVMPDWLNGPDHTEAWTPASEPRSRPPLPATEASWSPPSTEPAPWDATGDALEDADSATAEEGTPGEAWEVPEAPSTPPAEAGSDATGGGWTPMELDDDMAPAAPRAAPAPAGVQPTSQPEEESADDDDLEMFRSWLQSLKK